MKLSELQAMGAFAPEKLVKREIKFKRPEYLPESEWADPDVPEQTGEFIEDTVTVYIRRGSAADAIELVRAPEREQPFLAIHRAIVHADGKPVFESVEQAMSLQLWLAMPLFEAISEVAPKVPKALRRKKSGGANSP